MEQRLRESAEAEAIRVFGQNLRDLQRIRPAGATARLELLGAHDPDGVSEVPDPYNEGPEAFAAIYRQFTRCCMALAGRQPG